MLPLLLSCASKGCVEKLGENQLPLWHTMVAVLLCFASNGMYAEKNVRKASAFFLAKGVCTNRCVATHLT